MSEVRLFRVFIFTRVLGICWGLPIKWPVANTLLPYGIRRSLGPVEDQI